MKMVENGHIAICEGAFNENYYLAVGRTPIGYDNTGWYETDTPPIESADTTELLDELGKATESYKSYVYPVDIPDIELATKGVEYDIEWNGNFWKYSTTPTRFLYLMFKIESDIIPIEIIRQIAIYQNPVIKAGVPDGTKFYTPADLDDPGTIIMYENVKPITRTSNTREIFDFVLTF